MHFAVFNSFLGSILLVSKNGRLIELGIRSDDAFNIKKSCMDLYPDGIESPESFRKVYSFLDRYFKGERVYFDVDVDISNLRGFTQKVLDELKKIPYGELISYGNLGKRVGYENAARAVGQAVGRNPIPIIIPCHRVIRGDGSIGGFSMGLTIKEKLLAIERR